ncbi:MAG: hypothetical protein KBC94_00615 [Pseudacidovorax sp.]|uniref:hypothetical protein n=1 Tax=Pseudacidovorax sp. TaxID=1934311 RepID=UPI001B7641DD|nr:hypothetical protein [Pseudacidovorax sp.]MBP6892897.1 hypothetical protein [Pseudacidovorax sp.]
MIAGFAFSAMAEAVHCAHRLVGAAAKERPAAGCRVPACVRSACVHASTSRQGCRCARKMERGSAKFPALSLSIQVPWSSPMAGCRMGSALCLPCAFLRAPSLQWTPVAEALACEGCS